MIPRNLTPEQARAMSAARKRNGAGPGRPRSQDKRCPCGANTLKRAQARGFDCCKQRRRDD